MNRDRIFLHLLFSQKPPYFFLHVPEPDPDLHALNRIFQYADVPIQPNTVRFDRVCAYQKSL